MIRQWMMVLALSGLMAAGASAQMAQGQRMQGNGYQAYGSSQPIRRVSQAVQGNAEELPGGANQMQGANLPDAFADDEVSVGDAYAQGVYSHYGCGPDGCGSCDSCNGCDSSSWFGGWNDSQVFFTADYLYVRSSFSEATAYVEQDLSQPNIVARDVAQLDFDYESSYRFGGGLRRACCGDEIRFLYTRLSSEAGDEVPFSTDIFIPYEPGTPPGGRTVIDADVDVHAYDLECARRIPLSGQCCDCGDPCGSCCAPCPVWDLTWSAGIRAATAEWERSYTAFDAADQFVGDGVVDLDFDGVGAKVGLEGRRYFFRNGCLSMYAKGDLSLLVGDVEVDVVRTIEGGSVPDDVITQSFEARNVIPVTELEAGLSGQVTCNTRISAGYLLSAWHDLGFRDEFEVASTNVFPVTYDDANILGFDGFFARVEVAY